MGDKNWDSQYGWINEHDKECKNHKDCDCDPHEDCDSNHDCIEDNKLLNLICKLPICRWKKLLLILLLLLCNRRKCIKRPCCCCCVGPAGPAGATGPEGPVGPSGATGPEGPVGPSGATGPEGPVGPSGATGPEGPVGPAGATGPEGPVGPAGATGPEGPVGPAGATGPEGPVGPAGATGPEGPVGPAGATGPEGPVGPAGATGPEGPVGPAGATGPVGPAGPEGPAGTCECGTLECDCSLQIKNLLSQLSGVAVSVNLENGGSSINGKVDTGKLDEGVLILGPDSVSVCKIAWFSLIGNNTFESLGATILDLEEPPQVSCEEICEKGMRDRLVIGDTVSIRAGGTSTGNRRINDVEVGIAILGTDIGKSDIAVETCSIEDINT